MNVHEFVINLNLIRMLPDLDRRRWRMHDSRDAGRLALEIRIILLKVVRCALFLTFRREPEFSNVCTEQDPDAIQFRAFSGGVYGKRNADQQRGENCGFHSYRPSILSWKYVLNIDGNG